MTNSTPSESAHFLRRSLRANALFSTLSGLSFASAGGAIGGILGDVPAVLVVGVGVQLLLFAGALVWLSSRPEIPISLAMAVIVADLLWVLGTVLAVYTDLFSRAGAGLAMLVADVVLLLAILQSIGVHRMHMPASHDEDADRGRAGASPSVKWALAALVVLPILQWSAEGLLTMPIGPSRMLTIGLCAMALVPLARMGLEIGAGTTLSRSARYVTAVLVPLLAIAHLLAFARFADGPFGPVPGGPFEAAGVTPPSDWSQKMPFRYVELEVDEDRPRTLETVFLVHEDDLYVAANMPERKRWPRAVRRQGSVRVRFEDHEVYALAARFVESAEQTRELADAMNARYGFDLSMGGPIWFFALERTSGS
jgi:hypothetical protein